MTSPATRSQGHGDAPAPRLGELPHADVEHRLRRTDTDPKAAKRAERQVATMFVLSMVLVVAFIVAFVVIPADQAVYVFGLGTVNALHLTMGLTLGAAILLIGVAAIHWAKKLMVDVEVVAERHEMKSPAEDTAEAAAVFEVGSEQSGFTKYPLIRRTMIGAMALLPLPLLIPLRDLWATPADSPSPEALLSQTMWTDGMRLVTDITYQPVKASDVPIGGLVNVVPESLPEVEEEAGNLNARAKAAVIVIRMRPEEIVSQQNPEWGYEGILAFSKICTHVGCPISLYERRTHHLLCPCHQSTFDLADSGVVVFGPAKRRMPQLPIGVDAEGYLVARGDFGEPVGPSFWERGGNA